MTESDSTQRATPRRRHPRRRPGLPLCGLFLVWAGTSLPLIAADAVDASLTNRPFRLGFTSSMFTEVNESDARAAMKVWIMTVAQERHIPVDPEPRLLRTVEEAAAAIRSDLVDGVGVVTPEYERLCQETKFDRFAVGSRGGSITDEYVLVVRPDSGRERLDQLQGCSLNVLQNPRMSLALVWLDTILLEGRAKRSIEFFGRVTTANKASRVALPVFFRQADACLMNRRSYELMGELNPQLHQQLRILAASPPFVASFFAFRADYVSPHRSQMLEEMARLDQSPAGQQILALTQADRIEDRPGSCLDNALALLAKHHRLTDAANGNGGSPPVAAETSASPALGQ